MPLVSPRLPSLLHKPFAAVLASKYTTTHAPRYAMSNNYAKPRVHVLGLGSIGTFVAHSLAEVPGGPAVTLLLHKESLIDSYIRNKKSISLKTCEGSVVAHGNYKLEVLHDDSWYSIDPELTPSVVDRITPATDMIEHLIVCVKATQTVAALRPLRFRITPRSNIMFLQNGAGMIEDVNEHLFQDPIIRPHYISGVISHGITKNAAFDITHTGLATTAIGHVPRSAPSMAGITDSSSSTQVSYLLQALPLVPRFNCQSYDWPGIFAVQFEKIATNAFCNPLCALADSPNKYLFTIPETCKAIMSEISSVILALPELKDLPNVAERFSPAALESTVMAIIDRTRETTCSMVWDLRAGRQTEIRYINGFWSRKGRELGIPTPINDDLIGKIETRTPQSS